MGTFERFAMLVVVRSLAGAPRSPLLGFKEIKSDSKVSGICLFYSSCHKLNRKCSK